MIETVRNKLIGTICRWLVTFMSKVTNVTMFVDGFTIAIQPSILPLNITRSESFDALAMRKWLYDCSHAIAKSNLHNEFVLYEITCSYQVWTTIYALWRKCNWYFQRFRNSFQEKKNVFLILSSIASLEKVSTPAVLKAFGGEMADDS